MDVVRHVLAARGAGGMMRGLAPTLVREVTGTAIMFAVYEAGKRRLAQAQARPACLPVRRHLLHFMGPLWYRYCHRGGWQALAEQLRSASLPILLRARVVLRCAGAASYKNSAQLVLSAARTHSMRAGFLSGMGGSNHRSHWGLIHVCTCLKA